ncbi:MAG: sigma-E factor negative regulatory protein [bacterium]
MSTDKNHELLSMLLDDEPGAKTLSRSLGSKAHDTEFRSTVARYRLISASMKGEQLGVHCLDLAESVSRALDEEPTVLAPKLKRQRSRWVQPLMGGALAASVAAVAVLVGPQILQEEAPSINAISAIPVAEVQNVTVMPVVAKETRWKTLAPEVESDLNEYLEDHSEQGNWAQPSGVMPYTHYVSYDGR